MPMLHPIAAGGMQATTWIHILNTLSISLSLSISPLWLESPMVGICTACICRNCHTGFKP